MILNDVLVSAQLCSSILSAYNNGLKPLPQLSLAKIAKLERTCKSQDCRAALAYYACDKGRTTAKRLNAITSMDGFESREMAGYALQALVLRHQSKEAFYQMLRAKMDGAPSEIMASNTGELFSARAAWCVKAMQLRSKGSAKYWLSGKWPGLQDALHSEVTLSKCKGLTKAQVTFVKEIERGLVR